VQRLVGAPVISENKSINLTQLRRNKRTAKQRLGRKKPRVGDCDVNAAPDAESDNDKNENKEIVSKNYEEYNAIMEKFSSLEYEDAEARVVGLSSEDKFVISSCTVNREDLATLNSNEWLNDTVIHAYLNLLMDLNKAKKGNQVYVLPSFLAQRWHEKNLQGWLYTKVRLCKYKWILLPLHVNNSHWIILIANTHDKTVGIADSLSGDNSLKLDMFTRYMALRCTVTNKLGVWNKVAFNAPQQLDGDSCCIFTLMFVEAIINNVNINAVDPTAVTFYRRYIRARIVHRMRTNVDNEDICDIPFCVKPCGARLTWSQCNQCDRWCHVACAPH
jgi:Ulp1 family protease